MPAKETRVQEAWTIIGIRGEMCLGIIEIPNILAEN